MKVVCDDCKKELEITHETVKEKYLGSMLTEVYFNCPHCDKKYFVCLRNAKVRELQNEIDKLKNIIAEKRRLKYKFIPEALELEEITKRLKEEMNLVNGKA